MQILDQAGEKRNRTLNQLYIMVFKRLKRLGLEESLGLCNVLFNMYIELDISEKEYTKLRKHFLKNKPTKTKHVDFLYNKKNHENRVLYGFWWESKELEVRRLFINEMINQTKPWYVKLLNKFKK
jgi:hypothetical protein